MSKIEWIHVRHEEAAALAAGAAGASDGGTGRVRWQLRAGATVHLVNGSFDRHRRRVPVLAIAAQVPQRPRSALALLSRRRIPIPLFQGVQSLLPSRASGRRPDAAGHWRWPSRQAAGQAAACPVVAIPGDVAMRLVPLSRTAAAAAEV